MTEAETILAAAEAYNASEQAVRDAEYTQARLAARDSFAAYWAGSASSSVLRDYRAGRTVTVRA